MYKNVFGNNIIYVIENMTNTLSAYLKEELGLSIKYFAKGLNMDPRLNIGVFKCSNKFISDVYTDLCDNNKYDFYCCVDPGVLVFEYPMSKFLKIPFDTFLGVRFIGTKDAQYLNIKKERMNLELDLLYKDLGKNIENDFCSFSNKKYSKEDYGVLLCRRSFLLNTGLFAHALQNDFVHTVIDSVYVSDFDIEYSHDLYTFKLGKEDR